MACGIKPEKCTLYRQSDIPEISEIAVLLGNVVKIGRLQTCTTLKERVQKKRIPEGEVSYGLLGYPVLMASDILSVRTERVPVGEDQTQHVEMARDFARSFNHMFQRKVFVIPEMNVTNPLRVPGIDGQGKMGKSDGNTIALLEDLRAVEKKVMGIPTQARAGGEMEPGTQALYDLVQICCPEEIHTEYLRRYVQKEEKFFGEMKKQLAEDIVRLLEPIQQQYALLNSTNVRDVLAQGASRVRPVAASVLSDMQRAIGLSS